MDAPSLLIDVRFAPWKGGRISHRLRLQNHKKRSFFNRERRIIQELFYPWTGRGIRTDTIFFHSGLPILMIVNPFNGKIVPIISQNNLILHNISIDNKLSSS